MKPQTRLQSQEYPGDPAPEGTQNRAISIRQPYVEAILRGIKKIEYRNQPTRIRGRVYLYASLKPGDPAYYSQIDVEPGTLQTGVLLGTIKIVACIGVPGDYEHHLTDPERLSAPIKPEKHPQPVCIKPFLEERLYRFCCENFGKVNLVAVIRFLRSKRVFFRLKTACYRS